MIQFNLLPDVKLEYIRTQRLKQTVVSISAIVAGTFLTLLVLLFLVVGVFQKSHLRDVNHDISDYTGKIQSINDLNKILTVQNQLNSLTGLHNQKPVVSRLFKFISQVVPVKVTISTLNIDYKLNTMDIQGTANNLDTVNQFVDTLKFATYNSGSNKNNAFSNVVLSTFTRTDKGASYSVSMSFDKAIFDSSQDISSLTVPNIVTTRSEVDAPVTTFSSPTKSKSQ